MESAPRRPLAPSRMSDQFVLRMPDGMRDRIKSLSEVNRRSMNAELLVLIDDSLSRVQHQGVTQ